MFFYNYIGKQQTRNQIFLTFITDFVQDININIWHRHRQANLLWEANLNITPKRKRNYRKQHRHPISTPISSTREEIRAQENNNHQSR
jgi:hypothetical protein